MRSYFNFIAARCVFTEAEFLISIVGNIFSMSPLHGRHKWKALTSEIIHFVMILTFIFHWALLRFVFYSLCQRPILVKTYCTQMSYKQSYGKGHLRLCKHTSHCASEQPGPHEFLSPVSLLYLLLSFKSLLWGLVVLHSVRTPLPSSFFPGHGCAVWSEYQGWAFIPYSSPHTSTGLCPVALSTPCWFWLILPMTKPFWLGLWFISRKQDHFISLDVTILSDYIFF